MRSNEIKEQRKQSFEKSERLLKIMRTVLLPIVLAIGVSLAYVTIKQEHKKSIKHITSNLSTVVKHKSERITNFINSKFTYLNSIESNPTILAYIYEMTSKEKKEISSNIKDVVNNYLNYLSISSGFTEKDDTSEHSNGITILSKSGEKISSSKNTVDIEKYFIDQILSSDNEKIVQGIFISQTGKMNINFAIPLYLPEIEKTKESIFAYAVGTYEVDNKLLSLLKQEGETYKSYNHIISQKVPNNKLSTISLKNSKGLITVDIPKDKNSFYYQIANSFNQTVFTQEGNKEIIIYSVKIPDTNWILTRTIDRSEALKQIDKNFTNTIIIFVLITLFIIILTHLLLKNYKLQRELNVKTEKEDLIHRLINTNNFLKLVVDTQHDEIFVINENSEYIFANRKSEKRAKSTMQYLKNKPLDIGLGPQKAQEIIKHSLQSRKELKLSSHILKWDSYNAGKKEISHLRALFIPLEDNMMLITLHDITPIIKSQEESTNMTHSIVEMLSQLLSFRTALSPYKSEYVWHIVKELAKEEKLTPKEINDLKISTSLIDANKFFMSETLVRKIDRNGRITKEDKTMIHHSIEGILKLLKQTDFSHNIYETLFHKYEAYDGDSKYGTGKIKGEKIHLPARILKVAEDFVEMLIHKDKNTRKDFAEALNEILLQSGKKYDPNIVATLLTLANEKGGVKRWAHMKQSKKHTLHEYMPHNNILHSKK